jgi:hypothetical protein
VGAAVKAAPRRAQPEPAEAPVPVVYLAAVRRFTAILLLLLAAGSGCGYSLVGYSAGFDGIRTVAIETPENDSFVPGVEYVVADALRREFLRRGAVRVVDDPAAADLVLGGAVSRVKSSGRSFSSVVFSLEYELLLVLEIEARRADGQEIAIGERSLREREYFLASADIEATRKNRDEALRRIAAVLAKRIHETLFETASR